MAWGNVGSFTRTLIGNTESFTGSIGFNPREGLHFETWVRFRTGGLGSGALISAYGRVGSAAGTWDQTPFWQADVGTSFNPNQISEGWVPIRRQVKFGFKRRATNFGTIGTISIFYRKDGVSA